MLLEYNGYINYLFLTMISKKHFLLYSIEKQQLFLKNIVGNVETEINKSFLFCKKILFLLAEPSQKLLEYIFDVISKQLEEYRSEITTSNQKKLSNLQEKNHIQEEKDLKNLEDTLSKI